MSRIFGLPIELVIFTCLGGCAGFFTSVVVWIVAIRHALRLKKNDVHKTDKFYSRLVLLVAALAIPTSMFLCALFCFSQRGTTQQQHDWSSKLIYNVGSTCLVINGALASILTLAVSSKKTPVE